MTGKVALVTGASRGLGAALAMALARRSFHVIAAARTVGALEELDDRVADIGGSASLAVLDLTDDASVHGLGGQIRERWGRLDVLAHAAVAPCPLSPAGHIDLKTLRRSVETCFIATARLISCTEQLLRQADSGVAMFFDDRTAGDRFFGAHGGAKAAQIALAKSWQAESSKIGPKVLILEPEPMATKSRAAFHPGESKERIASPDAVAEKLLADVFDRPAEASRAG